MKKLFLLLLGLATLAAQAGGPSAEQKKKCLDSLLIGDDWVAIPAYKNRPEVRVSGNLFENGALQARQYQRALEEMAGNPLVEAYFDFLVQLQRAIGRTFASPPKRERVVNLFLFSQLNRLSFQSEAARVTQLTASQPQDIYRLNLADDADKLAPSFPTVADIARVFKNEKLRKPTEPLSGHNNLGVLFRMTSEVWHNTLRDTADSTGNGLMVRAMAQKPYDKEIGDDPITGPFHFTSRIPQMDYRMVITTHGGGYAFASLPMNFCGVPYLTPKYLADLSVGGIGVFADVSRSPAKVRGKQNVLAAYYALPASVTEVIAREFSFLKQEVKRYPLAQR